MAEDLYKSKNVGISEVRQAGYGGKTMWSVVWNGEKFADVYARTMASAIWTAGKFWGMDPRKQEFHQSCRVRRVRR